MQSRMESSNNSSSSSRCASMAVAGDVVVEWKGFWVRMGVWCLKVGKGIALRCVFWIQAMACSCGMPWLQRVSDAHCTCKCLYEQQLEREVYCQRIASTAWLVMIWHSSCWLWAWCVSKLQCLALAAAGEFALAACKLQHAERGRLLAQWLSRLTGASEACIQDMWWHLTSDCYLAGCCEAKQLDCHVSLLHTWLSDSELQHHPIMAWSYPLTKQRRLGLSAGSGSDSPGAIGTTN
jgi:hypothetical protein